MKKILLSLVILLAIYSSITTYKLNQSPVVLSDTIIVPGDTVFNDTTIYKPIPYKVTEYNVDTIEIPADTTELIKRYKNIYSRLYASKTYLDTLKNDSSATVILTVNLSQNSLDSLNMQFKNNRVTSIIINKIDNGVNFKAGLTGGYKSFSIISTYRLNNTFDVTANYDIYNKSFEAGILYNIK